MIDNYTENITVSVRTAKQVPYRLLQGIKGLSYGDPDNVLKESDSNTASLRKFSL